MKQTTEMNRLNGRRQTSWIWTSVAEELNQGLPRTNPASGQSFSYEHIEFFTKERVARRDFGNRASPIDRAHMKRPYSTSAISKLFHIISRFVRRVKFAAILKYHEWYLCQISRTIHAITCFYYINTNEIPSELSRENFISSHVKITCYEITVVMVT